MINGVKLNAANDLNPVIKYPEVSLNMGKCPRNHNLPKVNPHTIAASTSPQPTNVSINTLLALTCVESRLQRFHRYSEH